METSLGGIGGNRKHYGRLPYTRGQAVTGEELERLFDAVATTLDHLA
ncbi:hypothetical protein [Litchfieldella rifensis]|uniref:Uncharacterized protein n=1 Tax=Litchfieldella rifensis TaxID=762643 RepID=A0ABV7LRT4_9GAMM